MAVLYSNDLYYSFLCEIRDAAYEKTRLSSFHGVRIVPPAVARAVDGVKLKSQILHTDQWLDSMRHNKKKSECALSTPLPHRASLVILVLCL